jgi:hypothetical protein
LVLPIVIPWGYYPTRFDTVRRFRACVKKIEAMLELPGHVRCPFGTKIGQHILFNDRLSHGTGW